MIASRNRARLRSLAALPCLIALLAFPAGAFAQEKSPPLDFNFDPATTAIHWTLNTTIHTVHGTFKLKNGAVRIDPVTGDASGLIVIDATSGESGDSSRDARMHSAILESARYPTITFRPTHVNGKVDAAGPLTVNGILNLHGQDHPMQLTVNLHPQSAGVQNAAIASQTHFTIPFVAWGMKDPSTFIFRTDKEVTLDIDAIAVSAAGLARVR